MESRTSKLFKQWMTTSDTNGWSKHKCVKQGTAEDRVTAVNNALDHTSFGRQVSVFDKEGNVVGDLKYLLAHCQSILKDYETGAANYGQGRDQYGLPEFIGFVKWLLANPSLATKQQLEDFLNSKTPSFCRMVWAGVEVHFEGGSLEEFKAKLICAKQVSRIFWFADGSIKKNVWNASRFTESANLKLNIMTSSYFESREKTGLRRILFMFGE